MLPYTERAMSKTPLSISAGMASSTPALGTETPLRKIGTASSMYPRTASRRSSERFAASASRLKPLSAGSPDRFGSALVAALGAASTGASAA